MTNNIAPEAAAEVRRLMQEYDAAQQRTNQILKQSGMACPEFQEADKASGEIWSRIRELQGKPSSEWRQAG
jgi:hypothetical protein